MAALKDAAVFGTGLHMGYVDTDLAASVDAPKSAPRAIADLAGFYAQLAT